MHEPILRLLARQELGLDLDGPVIPPPPGMHSEFNNPPNQNTLARTVDLVALGLATISVFVRAIARFNTRSRINEVDILSTLAFVLFVPYVYVNYSLSWSGGYFVHSWNIRLRDAPKFQRVIFVASVLYIPILSLIKLAILSEWIRIFVPRGTRGLFWRACVVAIAAVATWGSLALILLNVNCTPFEANWNVLLPGGFCRFSFPALTLSSGAINLALDLVPLILPQKIIWSLQMSRSKKLGVSLIFAVGLVGISAALIRLILAVQFVSSPDQLYQISKVGLLSLTEIASAFLVLCIPSVPKAAASISSNGRFRLFDSWRSWYRSAKSSQKSPWPSIHSSSESRRHQDGDDRSFVPLTDLERSDAKFVQNGEGITRVVDFTTTIEPNPKAGNVGYENQHPWVRDSHS
ncbi:hypothetical protein F4680DRAFT_8261 [Xylaria scruposa]|nr:hypothetical protein F4680DRAFT_8261 [Xylaria scruposa]